jgi:threonine dehydratase
MRSAIDLSRRAAFAALLSQRYRAAAGERIAVLVCGGNTTAVNFSE